MISSTNPLQDEVDKVHSSGVQDNNEVMQHAVLLLPDGPLTIHKVVSTEIHENYALNFSHETVVEFIMGLGDYLADVSPHIDNMKVILKDVRNEKETTRTYRGYVLNDDDYRQYNLNASFETESLNQQAMARIRIQLVDMDLLAILNKTVGGSIQGSTIESVVSAMCASSFTESDDNSPKVIDVRSMDNTRMYGNIIVPHGTRAIDIATTMQTSGYGCYNGGVNTYIWKDLNDSKVMSTYPIFNTENGTERVLKIYSTHGGITDGAENTYVLDSTGNISITSNIRDMAFRRDKFSDVGKGMGFSAIEAESVMLRPHKVGKGKVETSKKAVSHDLVNGSRADKSVRRQNIGVTANIFDKKTQYMKQKGHIQTVEWFNSDPKYLIPGMSVVMYKVSEDSDSGIVSHKGVLHGSHTVIDSTNKVSATKLLIWMED